MTEVVSVQFRGRGKAYSFDPAGMTIAPGELLVVETAKGLELGNCVRGNHPVEDSAVVQPLRAVVRAATEDDRRVAEINRAREAEAMGIAEEKIAKHGLEMKLVDVECSFDGSKILFFFTADGRVDFRELVKDLASVFRTRIELRQIGVRDEAKMLGGLGICGQPFCCTRFLNDFQPVSTKMAKTQSMSLNPAKISGTCGRLMCCLRYEQEAYEDLVKHVPKNGAFVQTYDGYGNVVQVNLLRQTVKVRLDSTGEAVVHTYPVEEIAEVPGGRPPEGEPLPQLLQGRPKARPEAESAEDEWALPVLFADMPAESGAPRAESAAGEAAPAPARRRRRSRAKAPAQGEEKLAQGKGEKTKAASGGKNAPKSAGKAPTQKSAAPNKPAAPKQAARPQPAPAKSAPQPGKAPAQGKGEKTKAASGGTSTKRRRYWGKPKNKTGGTAG